MATPSLSLLILRCLSSSTLLVTYTQRYKKLSFSGDSRSYVLNALVSPEILQTMLLVFARSVAEMVYEKESSGGGGSTGGGGGGSSRSYNSYSSRNSYSYSDNEDDDEEDDTDSSSSDDEEDNTDTEEE